MSKVAKGLIAAFVVIVIAAGVGIFVWTRSSAEAPADVNAAAAGSPDGTAASSNRTSPDGSWKVQASQSVFVGYRVGEVLQGLQKVTTGRTNAVTGTMTIAGSQVTAVEVTADTTKLASDDQRRDGAISSRGLETSKFPQATFKMTKPLDLKNPQQGVDVDATITGDLTLHGVTKSVDVPVKAKWTGDQIAVATTGDGYAIAFSDYGMTAIEIAGGFVKTDDHGSLELQLLFVPA